MIFILISSIVILDLNPFSHSLINLQSTVQNTYPRRLSFSFENRNWKFVSNLSEENIIVSNIFHECLFSIEMNSWKKASCINFKSFRYFSRTEYERQKVSTLLEPNFSATNFSSFVLFFFRIDRKLYNWRFTIRGKSSETTYTTKQRKIGGYLNGA